MTELQLNFKLAGPDVRRSSAAAVAVSANMTAVLQHPGYAEEKLQRVAELLPCRELQAGMLLSLMGQVGNGAPGFRYRWTDTGAANRLTGCVSGMFVRGSCLVLHVQTRNHNKS